MQFRSLFVAAFAATVVSAQSSSDACAAGAIIGIFALCGSKPVDCGSNKCCLQGQKCVKADGDFKCADSALVPGATVTVNAACYGTASASASASAGASKSATKSASKSASATASGGGSFFESSPTPSSPTSSGPAQGAGYGSSKPTAGYGSSVPFTNATVTSGGFVTPSSTSSRGPVLATANAALSLSSASSSNLAALLSAFGLFAYLA